MSASTHACWAFCNARDACSFSRIQLAEQVLCDSCRPVQHPCTSLYCAITLGAALMALLRLPEMGVVHTSCRSPNHDCHPSEQGSDACTQVLEAYSQLRVPDHGEELEFQPDSGLQPIHYLRPQLPQAADRVRRTAVDAAETEAAESLAMWTVAGLAGVLSLENILMVLTCEHGIVACLLHSVRAVALSSCLVQSQQH